MTKASTFPNRQGSDSNNRKVYLVDGARTPFLKARGGPGPFTPVDLAVQCGRPLLMRQPFARDAFDQVILGCVNVIADEMNPSRVAALRLGMGDAMVAFTVQINCGSGMQSIDTAYKYIRQGESDLILAGGAEALSHAPLVMREEAVEWYAGLAQAKGPLDTAKQMSRLRPEFFKPVIGLERGLTDPITELNMGQTAEVLAHHFRPEFINRVDETVVFHPLGESEIRSIAQFQLQLLYKRLEEKEYQLELDDEALSHLARTGFDPVFGARPLKRAIQHELENPLAQKILSGELEPAKPIKVSVENERLVITQ